jgi:DNA-binding CsgD family transcriptional regulator
MTRSSSDRLAEMVLYSRFRLTGAETQIALGIYRGRTLAAIAAARGISVQTARTQLKSVFAKTGTHRQVQLAFLLSKMWADLSEEAITRRPFSSRSASLDGSRDEA